MTDAAHTARKTRRRWLSPPLAAVVLWALLMAPLLRWGLPDSSRDDLLFDGGPPWQAADYALDETAAAMRDRPAGADTDRNPLATDERRGLLDLTATEAQRAEILLRYRLYTRQPDELIIVRALQQMNPRAGDLDPRLYQYGGAYIYLLGATLGAAAVSGLVTLTTDLGYYLEHPAAIGRFYIVFRGVSLVFGGLALLAVYHLARRAGGRGAGWAALFCVALAPVFITAVLEAKPHLPSACAVLWATYFALDYYARGRRRNAVLLGLLGGYAGALVLTGVVAALLWPALWLAVGSPRRRAATRDLALAAVLGMAVWLVTNPYIPYNFLFNRAALLSNLANSTAMYEGQAAQLTAGLARSAVLLWEGAGAGPVLAGLIGAAWLLRRYPRPTCVVLAAGVGMLFICGLTGAGKPAEFARFLILPALLLAVAAGWLVGTLARRRAWLGILAAVLVLGSPRTGAYVRAFLHDTRGTHESRRHAAIDLLSRAAPHDAIAVLQEPAPYAVPPLDFTQRRVLLLPPTAPADLAPAELPPWLVFTADDERAHADAWWHAYYAPAARYPAADHPLTPITWADKPVFIYTRTTP